MSVFWLDSPPASDPMEVGGKAANIARIGRLGFSIPLGFVISVKAFQMFLDENGLANELHSLRRLRSDGQLLERLSAIRASVDKAPWPAKLKFDIASAYDSLSGSVAIRSSGRIEDSRDSSFAGAFSSFLNRSTEEEVLDAVRSCWKSAFSTRVATYRLEHELVDADWMMGVIVQKMVIADRAGVMFTHEPFNDKPTILIEAVAGSCDEIVAGRVADLTVRVDHRTKRIIHVDRASRSPVRFGSGATTLIGTTGARVPRILDMCEINELTETGLRLEEAFDAPQDIEWALAAGKLVVLQARPLTVV